MAISTPPGPLLQRSPDLAVGDGVFFGATIASLYKLQRSPDLAVGDGPLCMAEITVLSRLQRSPDLAVGDGAPGISGGTTDTYHFTFERATQLD